MLIPISKEKIRLAGFYFTFYASLGLFNPYWSLYLESLHYSPLQIGITMASLPLANIIAPGISGALADKYGRQVYMMRWLTFGCVILFTLSLINHDFIWQLVSLFAVFLAYTAISPLRESTVFHHLQGETQHYGKLRLWGTIGFITMTLVGGYLTDSFGIGILPYFWLLILSLLAGWSWVLRERPIPPRPIIRESFFQVSNNKNIIILYTSCFFIVMAHGFYNAFYSIHLLDQGYDKAMIGAMWMVATTSEIGCFILVSYLLVKINIKKIYLCSFIGATIRFIFIGWYADVFWLLILLQLLHGCTFSMHHAASMVYLEKYYSSHFLSRAQALYVSGSYGLGAALGGIIAGATWNIIGAGWVFTLASGLAFIGFLIACQLSNKINTSIVKP